MADAGRVTAEIPPTIISPRQQPAVKLAILYINTVSAVHMHVRMVKMRNRGVEVDRRALRDAAGTRGQLVIADVTDQGLHRPCKTARLLQGQMIRAELKDVSLVWANEGRMTLAGYEQIRNEAGQDVDYRQSWLVIFDTGPDSPDLSRRKVAPRP